MHRIPNLFKVVVITTLMILIYGVVNAQTPGVFTSTPAAAGNGAATVITPTMLISNTAVNPVTLSNAVRMEDDKSNLNNNAVIINSIAWQGGLNNATSPIKFALKDGASNPVNLGQIPWDLSANNQDNDLLVDFSCQNNTITTNTLITQTLLVTTNSPNSNTVYSYTVNCQVDASVFSARNSTNTAAAPPVIAMPLTQPSLFDNAAPLTETVIVLLNTGGVNSLMTVNASLSNATGNMSLVGGSPQTINIPGNGGTTNGGVALQVTCTPDVNEAPTTYSETLTLTHNAPAGGAPSNSVQYTVTCTVTGTATYFSQTNTGSNATNGSGIIDLGSVIVGQPVTVADALLISNTGNNILKITGMSIVGDPNNPTPPLGPVGTPNNVFTITNGTVFDLPANSSNSKFVSIQCSPLTITNPGDPYVATLTVNYQDQATGAVGVATYTLNCQGTEQRPIYHAFVNAVEIANNSTILMGDVPTNGSASITITITNTGTANLVLQGHAFSAGPIFQPDKFSLTGTVQTIPAGGQGTVNIICTPAGTSGLMQAEFTISHNPDNNSQVSHTYTVRCNGVAGGPIYDSVPAVGSTIVVTSGTAGQTLVISNIQTVGSTNLIVNAPSFSGTPGIFSITVSGGGTFPLAIAPTGSRTLTITCSTLNNITVTMSVPYGTANTAAYTVQCVPNGGGGNATNTPTNTQTGGGTGPVYASNPGVGSTLSISAPLSASGKTTLTITNTGTANLIIETLTLGGTNAAVFSVPALGNNNSLPAGQSGELEIGCQASTAGTYTATLSIGHNASNNDPATYSLSCVVSNVTATPSGTVTGTALPPVTGTAIAECPDGQVLSTPFPQNASGEFLLVNCFIISQAGTVNISLAQLLASPAAGITDTEKAQISANAGLISVWRMGSWFLTESTYNAATQTYSFQSASGTGIYAFFYGAITRPVGSQGGFAGTTTGDVKDVTVDDGSSPIAAIIATILVIFFVGIFLSRRFRSESGDMTAS